MELERQVNEPTQHGWMRRHVAGLACFALGIAAVAVTALVHLGGEPDALAKIPDVRVTTPFLVLALVAAVAAFVRREGAYALPLAGVVLSAVSMILGWALVIAAVAVAAGIAILILSEMM